MVALNLYTVSHIQETLKEKKKDKGEAKMANKK